jgi:hypothetical protein
MSGGELASKRAKVSWDRRGVGGREGGELDTSKAASRRVPWESSRGAEGGGAEGATAGGAGGVGEDVGFAVVVDGGAGPGKEGRHQHFSANFPQWDLAG